MKTRLRIFLFIGQGLCALSTLGFTLLFVFQGGLGFFFHPESMNTDLLWLFVPAVLEAPIAVIGLLQSFKPIQKVMLWPSFLSFAYLIFYGYKAVASMTIMGPLFILYIPNLFIALGGMALLTLGTIKAIQEKRANRSVPRTV